MILNKVEKAENSPLELKESEDPVPGYGEVLLETISSGICRSNLHMIEGDWLKYGSPAKLPIIPGHEAIGRVIKTGEGVSIKKGTVVGVQPLWSSCGRCSYCLSGNDNLCSHGEVTGETVNGTWADRILARESHVYPLPDFIDPTVSAPLFCPGVTAFRAVERASISPGLNVGIVGVGGVGHIALQIAARLGANVSAITTSEKGERLSREIGIEDVINAGRDYSSGDRARKSLDRVIVFAPDQRAINFALSTLKKRGRMVLGVYGSVEGLDFTRENEIIGSVIGSSADVYHMFAFLKSNPIKIKTRKYRLEDLNSAILDLKNRNIEGRGIITFH